MKVHHPPLELVDELDLWIEGHTQAAEKWEARIAGIGRTTRTWKTRARRAEAEREAARTIAYSTAHGVDARAAAPERELEEMDDSLPGGSRQPLRRLNRGRPLVGAPRERS